VKLLELEIMQWNTHPRIWGFARVWKLAHVAVGAAEPSVTLCIHYVSHECAANSWRPRLHGVPHGLAGGGMFCLLLTGTRLHVCSQ